MFGKAPFAGRPSIVFLYLGRRGALARFTLDLAMAAQELPEIGASFAISEENDTASEFRWLGSALHEINTFSTPASPSVVTNFGTAKKELLLYLERLMPSAVVNLMPHVWTPLLAPSIRRIGIKYLSVIHDVHAHPGDPAGYLNWWLLRETRSADVVITLSKSVADDLVRRTRTPQANVVTLFHPDLRYGRLPAKRSRDLNTPLKVLFFGRILKYKSLPVLVEAIEILRSRGVRIDLGVAGKGDLSSLRGRLTTLNAEVINRWIDDSEVAPLLARYDAMVLSHSEASQSGVAATAFGHGMPVVGVPIGGIAEQVVDGRTGVLASDSSARALADAIDELSGNPELYGRIAKHLSAEAHERSMTRFVRQVASEAIVH